MWSAPRTSHRETSDDYTDELHRFGRWRVVLCRDALQFVLQVRVSGAEGDAGARWAGRAFCVTRAALLRLWQANTRDTGRALERLPERAPMLDLSSLRPTHETT